MATAPETIRTEPDPNSPVGGPPEGLTPSSSEEIGIAEALFGDSTEEADRIAAVLLGGDTPASGEAPQAAIPGAGETGSAPVSPDTPPAGTTPATPAAVPPATGTPPGPAPASAPPAPAPAAPPANEAPLREASLTAQVSALSAELERLRANPQGQPPAPAAPESGQPSGQPTPLERFNLTLPQELTQAIFSDDEGAANASLTRLINDVSTVIYHSATAKAAQYVDQRIGQLVSAAEQGQTEQVRSQAREQGQAQYFEAFPDHKNPLIEPIITQQAQAMASEFPGLQWGPDYINALGARVQGYIAQISGQAPPAQPEPLVPVGQVPPARPAAMIPVGSGRAGGAPGSEPEGADLILETLAPFG